ncbi:kinase-like protein [Mollisia scopiformis]|uniref:cyclin-dependent kinase n=1 Tax=Mollisia scopiformis TaxID=149040 RepID=A0A194XI60_MOLSC|nr:kinase-like protein [Mollisia scopiformis]KUJ19848.1 kinase-like protein [Mollisia scopiformis]
MSTKQKSRWADDEEDAVLEAQRKKEKEEKKRAKAEKQRRADEAAALRAAELQGEAAAVADSSNNNTELSSRPAKRRRISPEIEGVKVELPPAKLLRFPSPEWKKCRSVEDYEKLNDIEEGAYGWVSRAKDSRTGNVVALKRLKMDNANDGIPVTGLREIQTLMDCEHPNIVALQEVVVGEDTSKIENIFLVLDFLEHDLKTLLEDMSEPFLTSEIKTLLHQLTSGVSYLHQNWILHRDLKTSNLLLNNRGVLKIADFGMARYFGDPPPKMTQLVVTLWYRAPELLLGAERYGTPVDMWSIGCIFGELLTKEPLLQGKNEVDELSKIFELCGIPTEETWPGFKRLPNARSLRLPQNPVSQGSVLRAKFPFLTKAGSQLLIDLLALNPGKRPSAQEVLEHAFFREEPRMKSAEMFPTFPSKAGQEKRRRRGTPNAPMRGNVPEIKATDFSGIFAGREDEEKGGGFSLKLI